MSHAGHRGAITMAECPRCMLRGEVAFDQCFVCNGIRMIGPSVVTMWHVHRVTCERALVFHGVSEPVPCPQCTRRVPSMQCAICGGHGTVSEFVAQLFEHNFRCTRVGAR